MTTTIEENAVEPSNLIEEAKNAAAASQLQLLLRSRRLSTIQTDLLQIVSEMVHDDESDDDDGDHQVLEAAVLALGAAIKKLEMKRRKKWQDQGTRCTPTRKSRRLLREHEAKFV